MSLEEAISILEKMRELSEVVVPQKKEKFDVATAVAIECMKRVAWRCKDDE